MKKGQKVIVRPRWSRQWVDGLVLWASDRKCLVEFGVETDLFGGQRYRQAQWLSRRHIRQVDRSSKTS